MQNLIELKFSDESWEKITQSVEEAEELSSFKQLIKTKSDSKSLALRDVLEVSC